MDHRFLSLVAAVFFVLAAPAFAEQGKTSKVYVSKGNKLSLKSREGVKSGSFNRVSNEEFYEKLEEEDEEEESSFFGGFFSSGASASAPRAARRSSPQASSGGRKVIRRRCGARTRGTVPLKSPFR